MNRRRTFWWSCCAAAVPLAFAAAAFGFALPVGNVPRDLVLITIGSVAEELVFRGALQPALARWFGPRHALGPLTAANLATSAVFALAHLWRHPWPLALAVFPVSLLYGAAREQSGRVAPAAGLHLGFNLLLYAASWSRASA